MRIRRVFGVAVGVVLTFSLAPALAASASDPDISFTVDVPATAHGTVHIIPSADAADAMTNGSELTWDWGDGTYCVTNPDPQSGYVADPNSSCSDPSDVQHTYPTLPRLYLQWFVITLGPGAAPTRYGGYAAYDAASPYGPYPSRPWSNVTVYDDQSVTVDLTRFTTRYDPATLTTEMHPGEFSPWPFHGSAVIRRRSQLVLTPDGIHHHVEQAAVDFQPSDRSGSSVAVNVDVVRHTLPQIVRAACTRQVDPRTHRFRCTIAEHSADRSGTSTRFRTTVVSAATGATRVTRATALAGGSTRTVTAYLRRGVYRVRVVNADGRTVVRRLVVGSR